MTRRVSLSRRSTLALSSISSSLLFSLLSPHCLSSVLVKLSVKSMFNPTSLTKSNRISAPSSTKHESPSLTSGPTTEGLVASSQMYAKTEKFELSVSKANAREVAEEGMRSQWCGG